MWIRNSSRLALLITALCLSGCGQSTIRAPSPLATPTSVTTNLPGVVQFAHSGDALEIIWYRQPFSGEYDQLTLKAGGRVERWRVTDNWAFQGGNNGQLTGTDRQEIKAILDKLRGRNSNTIPSGSLTIGLGFSWRSDSQVLYFSDLTCTDELRRLFEITYAALYHNPSEQSSRNSPCASGKQYSQPMQTQIPLEDATRSSTQPPDLHTIKLFTLSWTTQPETNVYEMLSLYSDNSLYYYSGVNEELHLISHVRVNDIDRQIVRGILESMTTLNSVPSAAGSAITLSFPWEGDYHVMNVANTECPDGLQNLFDLANSVLERESSGNKQISTPCQGR